MHCSLHVHSELVPHETKGPKFYSMSEGMVSGKRTIWRCPIPGCTWVAMEFDAEKVNPKLCRKCKQTIDGASSLCTTCGQEYRRMHPKKYIPIGRHA